MDYEIWSEGYSCTGDGAPALFHGLWSGDSFKEACRHWADKTHTPELFDSQQLTYWGCRLFDNENDARKSFG